MNWLYRVISDRLKSMFIADAVLDLESQFIVRQAERKVEMLMLADRYEQEGRTELAEELRRDVDNLSAEKPLSSIKPAIEHWKSEVSHSDDSVNVVAQLEEVRGATKSPSKRKLSSSTKKRVKKKAR